MHSNLLLATGLLYGLLGALILYLSHRSVYGAATQLVAGYPRVLAKLRANRYDGRFGLGVLTCGIVLQALAASGYSVSLDEWRYPAVASLTALLLYSAGRLLASGRSEPRAQRSAGRTIGKRVYETRRSLRLREAALAEAPRLYALEQALERRLGVAGRGRSALSV